MPKTQSDVNVANGGAINFAYDVTPIWYIDIYPFRLNQSIPL